MSGKAKTRVLVVDADRSRQEMAAGIAAAAEMLVGHLEALNGYVGDGKAQFHLMTRSLLAARQIRDALRMVSGGHGTAAWALTGYPGKGGKSGIG